jgi:hypothetical protein
MNREHLAELKAQIKGSGSRVTMDLKEVRLVDVEIVRFLGICQREGVDLLLCSPYTRDWIAKEAQSYALALSRPCGTSAEIM